MEQLSIWNDFTTSKQRYLNLMHGLTRIDQHPRRLHKGKNLLIQRIEFKIQFQNFTGLCNRMSYIIKDSIQNIRNRFIQLFNNLIRTKKKKYSFIAVCLVIVVVIIALTVSLWSTSDNTGTTVSVT